MSLTANSCLNLSFDLLIRKVNPADDQETPKNVAVSPLSLDAVVAMLGAGCSQPSVSELLRFAKCENVEELKSKFRNALNVVTNSGGPNISFVNAAWIDKRYSFQPQYEECLKNTFKIEASNTCDFVDQVDEAVKEINSWAESQTNGLIKNLVSRDELKPNRNEYPISVILTNALYFKGFWQNKFYRESTKKRDFYLINGEKISDVPFMTSKRVQRYRSFDEYKVLEMPYQGSNRKQFCMQIVLPHKEDGLQSLLEKLNNHNNARMLNFDLERASLDSLWIPKFKFSTILRKDDLKIPFLEDEKTFELAKMLQDVAGMPSVIPSICQKVFVEVDEEGTEAAAVTYSPMSPGYSPPLVIPPPKTFVADHPFLFIIKEKESGLVLFLGTVLNPLEEQES